MQTIPSKRRVALYLAGEFYVSRQAIMEKAANILSGYAPNDRLRGSDFLFARDLFKAMDSVRFAVDSAIQGIFAHLPDSTKHGRPRVQQFLAVCSDGSQATCGYRSIQALRVIETQDFRKACATAVEQQIENFSRKNFRSTESKIWLPASKSWISYRDHEVEYYPDSFVQLVDRYVADTQLDVNRVFYVLCQQRPNVLLFVDANDRREWQNWHRIHAKLRIVKKSESLQEVL